MSINDIRSILNPLTEKYFGNDDGFTMQDVYTEVFSLEAEESQKLLKDLGKKYKIAGETFEDFPDEDQKFLHTFSFICMLSFDVYIKKMLIERMIDNLNEEKEASSHENTHSGKESKKQAQINEPVFLSPYDKLILFVRAILHAWKTISYPSLP